MYKKKGYFWNHRREFKIPFSFLLLIHQMFASARLNHPSSFLRLKPHKPSPIRSSSMSSTTITSSNPAPTKTVKVVIKGRVQGVFFRDWTVETARELGLNGWVRNRRDGSVEAVFSGDPDAVTDMVEKRCRVGPPSAMVTAVNAHPVTADGDDLPGQGFHRKPTV